MNVLILVFESCPVYFLRISFEIAVSDWVRKFCMSVVKAWDALGLFQSDRKTLHLKFVFLN